MQTSTLPETVQHYITRDSLIFGLADKLDSHGVVVVNGPSNVGKTSLLAAFYKQNEPSCVASFLNGNSIWGYDPEMVIDDLLLQITKLIPHHKEKDGVELETPFARWRTALATLNRSRVVRGKRVLFILDGLDDIPESEQSTARTLFELLPIGSAGIRFLITGTRATQYAKEKNVKDVGEFSVTGFTQDEAAKYLADLMSAADAAKLFPLSRGNPGYYSGVRRIIENQGKLPDQMPTSLTMIFEWEWAKVRELPYAEQLAAYICFDRSHSTVAKAARYLEIGIEETKALIAGISFLDEVKQEVAFVHESIKLFIRDKLAHLKKPTVNRLIDLVSMERDETTLTQQLPELYDEAGRYTELIDYLDDNYILAAVRSRKVARFVQEKALLGLKAAAKEDKADQIIRFGLHGANLDELYLDNHWNYRVQAFVSIGEMPAALALARSFSLAEDRLQALCSICLSQKAKNGRFDDALVDEIKREYSQLATAHLGRRVSV